MWIAPEIAELIEKLQPTNSAANDFVPMGQPTPPSPPSCSTSPLESADF